MDGAGLKIKVVEALEHGLPALASADTIAGLPEGYDSCVLPLNETCAGALLNDPGNLDRASRAATNYITGEAWTGDLELLIAHARAG